MGLQKVSGLSQGLTAQRDVNNDTHDNNDDDNSESHCNNKYTSHIGTNNDTNNNVTNNCLRLQASGHCQVSDMILAWRLRLLAPGCRFPSGSRNHPWVTCLHVAFHGM